MQYEEFEDTKG